MLSFLTGNKKQEGKDKKPSDKIVKSKKELLKLINENLVHILNEEYPDNKSVITSDIQIALQCILIAIAGGSFYLTKKFEFEFLVPYQWVLVALYFSISVLSYAYDTYSYYFINSKSGLAYRNTEKKLSLLTKLDYASNKDKWPTYLVINKNGKIPFKDIADKESETLDYDKLKKLLFDVVVNKKKQ